MKYTIERSTDYKYLGYHPIQTDFPFRENYSESIVLSLKLARKYIKYLNRFVNHCKINLYKKIDK